MAPLADGIISALRKRFDRDGHFPSEAHWEGLRAIACEIEKQANGTAPHDFAYSALPTGMGKTSVVVEGVRILTSDRAFADVGVIIFVNQLAQIPALIKDMELQPDQFAVSVGKDRADLNAMGRCAGVPKKEWPHERRLAQVLFVTQQKLPKLPRFQRNFAKLFSYHTRPDAELEPRRVRIWDEAIIPAKPLTISESDALTFSGTLFKHGHAVAANKLRGWIEQEIKGKVDVTQVPMILFDLNTPESFDRAVEGEDEIWGDDTHGSELLALQGLDVRVHNDAYTGSTVISYRNFLPHDFAPLLILDASGSHRLVYKLWGRGRGRMRQLPSPGKTYRNLRILHWDRAAGKAAYRNSQNQDDLAEGILRAFQAVPEGEKMLVIFHKAGITDKAHRAEVKDYANLELRVREKVRAWGGAKAENRLCFLTWGRHMASNEFADIRHVIVVGLLQYSQPQNDALYRAALGATPETEVSVDQINELRLGEIAHNVLQGVGRGAVRKTTPDGDVPPGCVLWVIFSTYRNMMWVPLGLLAHVFPGATIERWEPLGIELKGGNLKSKNRRNLLDRLITLLGERASVSFEVKDLVGDGLSYQTAAKLLKDPHLRRALAERGVVSSEEKKKVERAGSWTRAIVYTLQRDVEGVQLTTEAA